MYQYEADIESLFRVQVIKIEWCAYPITYYLTSFIYELKRRLIWRYVNWIN